MPRSAIIWTRSRELSLNVRYHRTHSTMISWSKCRPLKRSCAELGSIIPTAIAGAQALQARLHQNLGSGSAGDGTLRYMGHTYPFRVGGLGIGGIGVSTVQATGEAYGLRRLSDFPGAYG